MFIFYDISNNRIREKVINMLLDYSFIRVQYSVFLGEISKKTLQNILQPRLNSIISKEDSLFFLPICLGDFQRIYQLGVPFSYLYEEQIVLF